MQDEQFIRQWNAGHDRLSLDLDRGIGKLGRRVAQTRRGHSVIRDIYGIPSHLDGRKHARLGLSPAAQASLRGLAASVITFALWITVMALATPAQSIAAPLGVTLA